MPGAIHPMLPYLPSDGLDGLWLCLAIIYREMFGPRKQTLRLISMVRVTNGV